MLARLKTLLEEGRQAERIKDDLDGRVRGEGVSPLKSLGRTSASDRVNLFICFRLHVVYYESIW